MANRITYRQRPELEAVQMSNGLTSVFIAVLSLAASSLAKSDRQFGSRVTTKGCSASAWSASTSPIFRGTAVLIVTSYWPR